MLQRNTAVVGTFLLAALFPLSVSAAVRLNEIAWMGTALSGTDEWIELSNDSASAVDLSSWKIDAEDGSPSIELSGTIAPNGFFLIERTDDTTVPGVTADLVAAFGNGLGNTGETLRLRDASGAIVDTVVGGADWGLVGGDNTTKETAQRLPAGTSWTTGAATPRAANVSGGEVLGAQTTTAHTDTAASSTSTTASTEVKKSAYAASVYPRDTMTVSAGRDLRVFTGFSVSFSGAALGLYDETLPYATYRWNFGDGAVGVGKSVTHAYRFPGEYTVTLQVYNASLEATDRLLVSVTPASVTISRASEGPGGFVELENGSDREVDISGWILALHSGTPSFVFPPYTTLAAKRATVFPNAITGVSGDTTTLTLRLMNGADVFVPTPPVSSGVPTVPTPHSSTPSASLSTILPPATPSSRPSTSVAPVVPVKEVVDATVATGSAAATVLWSREGKSPISGFGQGLSSSMRWFFVFFGMLLLGVAGVLLLRSRIDEPSPADEYAIISDIIEEGDEEINLVRK